jgi:hypothetical protein
LIGTLLVFISALLLFVALTHQRAQHSLQRLAVIGQSNKIGCVVHLLIGRKSSLASYLTH